MATQQVKRMIGIPAEVNKPGANSTIAGGTSSMLPTDTATTKLPKPATPASVTNPASLTPGTTVKSFSDNMTKPFGVDSTAPTSIKPPVDNTATPKTPQGNAIGQNADGSYIYEQSKPTTPATTPAPVVGTTTGTPATGITSPKPEFSGSLYDANNYLGSGKTKDQFTAMDVADQTNLINQAVQNVEERQAILDQVKVYAENKAKQEYQAKQNTISTNIQTGQNEIAQTQASQRIREAQTNLDNLKQNLGFLGTGGRPMKSATAIEGASRMLIQSEQTFNELKTIESEYKKMRDSGVEFNANAFEEQMRTLQKQLTDSVDASIIQAMQGFDSEAALASIDSPKKLFDLQQKYLDMVDTSVEGITNRQVNEMKNLQTRYADYAKQYAEDLKQRQTQQAEFTKNKNTLNENMSKAVGYYVDGNGSPLQTTDGKVIEYKDEADKPIIDWNTGKVAYFNTDANGNQVVEIKQLFTPEQKSPNIQKVGVGADGKDIYGYYDSATGQVKTVSTPSQTTGGAGSTAIDTIKKWEGFRENAYQDSVGKWTIGYGFTNVDGKPVQPGMTMDRGTADSLLQQEINQRQNFMNYITVPLSDSQKAALSSFEFNLGSGRREMDAMPILNKINAGDLQGAGELMKQFNKGKINGVLTPIQGLSNRRNEEARLLQTKDTTNGMPVGGSGAPIDYERRIKNMVPATLMNSEIELKQLNDTIKALHDSGKSAEDAVLTYLGVSIDKPEDKDFASKIISVAKGLDNPTPAFYSNVSDFINKGDRVGAVMKLEREATAQAQKNNPDLKFSDAGTSFVVKQAKEIQDLMSQYESKFGPVKGTRSEKTKGIFGDKEAQKLATKITQAISKARNDLVGSNITQGEKDTIKDLIPALSETAETAKVKVQNLIDTPLMQYNEARRSVGLPELTVDTLLNRNNRVNLYNGSQLPEQMQSTNTVTGSLSGGTNRLQK